MQPCKQETRNRLTYISCMNSGTAKAFRAIATSRQSCRRFQPNRIIPQAVLKDIIEVTNVSKVIVHTYKSTQLRLNIALS
jgi:hypothetical protein